jgi:hypothetical protein
MFGELPVYHREYLKGTFLYVRKVVYCLVEERVRIPMSDKLHVKVHDPCTFPHVLGFVRMFWGSATVFSWVKSIRARTLVLRGLGDVSVDQLVEELGLFLYD